MSIVSRFIAVSVAAALLVAAACAGTVQAKRTPLKFVGFHTVALQGKTVRVAVDAKSGTMCSLSVRYADRAVQAVGRAYASNGRAAWEWQVPDVAKPGRASVTASCTGRGRASRTVTIVGNLIPPKIVVQKQGFSVRARSSGSAVSYGLMLQNLSPNADALDVYVLVNFVLGDGHVLGTDANTVPAVAAGTTYAYGGSLDFPGAAPIVQLEVVIKIGDRQRALIRQPVVENVRVLPNRSDATWVGEVDGEVINRQASLNLQRTALSTVVFDAAGNILGGGSGSASALLPPGTREAFVIRSDLDAIPFGRAASAKVSPLGTYVP